ncbi:hypothetical protein G9A89_021267 [Geosiphon pyriformis]|nr:hypothetical protein G9A89_021267 [Geosiphon pyriformis]
MGALDVPIKALVIKATQYQALIGNDWLSKANTMLNWNTQELQISQNSQHLCVPATCDHFKTITMPSAPLIEFEEKEEKLTWEAYQVSWANTEHNKLSLVPLWDDNRKEKQKEKLIWETNHNSEELTTWEWDKRKKGKGKAKEKEPLLTLICINCGKKLSSIGACCGNNEEYQMVTKFYYHTCIIEHFGQPKWQEKWNNKSCLACKEILLDEEI